MKFDNMQIFTGAFPHPDGRVSIVLAGKKMIDVDETDILLVPHPEMETIFVSQTINNRVVLHGPEEKLFEFMKQAGYFNH